VRREGEAWLLDTEEGVFRARLLVGADGPTSLVRQSLAIQLDQHEYPEAAVILHGRQPDWLPPRCVCIVLHPEGSILLVPTTPEGRYRVPVLVERADVPHWMSAGDDEIRARLAARYPKLASVAVERSSGGSHVYRLTRQHARTYVGECTALVGDAAHVTHPSGGQGMNLAIQDAGALAQYTGLVLGSPAASRPHLQDAIARSLAEYEKERRPINNRAMVVADRTARLARPGWMAYASAVAGARVAAILPGVPRLFVDLFGGG
jgi:2-polyprenyl-6-methoxyphenol hydroxylase-like FAD-dependent oxidoreductase